jgi:hypothetical protein
LAKVTVPSAAEATDGAYERVERRGGLHARHSPHKIEVTAANGGRVLDLDLVDENPAVRAVRRHVHRVCLDLDGRGYVSDNQLQGMQVDALLGGDVDSGLIELLEPGLRDPQVVVSRHEAGKEELSTLVAIELKLLLCNRIDERYRRSNDQRAGGIDYRSAD